MHESVGHQFSMVCSMSVSSGLGGGRGDWDNVCRPKGVLVVTSALSRCGLRGEGSDTMPHFLKSGKQCPNTPSASSSSSSSSWKWQSKTSG